MRSEVCIKLPDEIIAATAKTANLHLVTRNALIKLYLLNKIHLTQSSKVN